MALELRWIDRIFDKLTMVYGREFLQRWEGIDLNAVKADWAHELDGFDRFAVGIKYALQNLPNKPPTVLEFRALARRAPEPEVPRLDSPKANPEIVKAALFKARQALTRGAA